MKHFIPIVFCFLCLVSCHQKNKISPTKEQLKQTILTFPEWKINLDQTIRSLEEDLASLHQQQSMNLAQANLCSLYDAKLKLLFYESLEKLPHEKKLKALAQQSRWLKNRKLKAEKAYQKYKGGTFASFNYGVLFLALTKAKIQELEQK